MKKFFLHHVRRFSLALFFTVSLGLAEVWSQVALAPVHEFGPATGDLITTADPNEACLSYSAGIANTTEFAADLQGVSGLTYSWSVVGGAEIVGSTTGSTVEVEPIIVDNRYNKARLILNYTGTKEIMITDPCHNPPLEDVPTTITISGRVRADLYQKFTVTDPIVGEECIEAGKDYAFSIRDMVSGDKDGIGADSYEWNLTNVLDLLPAPPPDERLYTSGDGSAIALRFLTSPETPTTFSVIPGKCNTTPVVHTLKTLMPAPSYAIGGYDNNDCIPASVTQITITNTNVVDDVVYTWELANSNFTFVGTATDEEATIKIGAYAGFIYLKASPDPSSSLCAGTTTGEVIAIIEIKRSLDESVKIVGVECVDPSGDDPEYTLNPNPGTKVHWEFPDDINWTIAGDEDNINASTVTVSLDDASAGPGTIEVATLGCLDETISLEVNFPPGTVGEINDGTEKICLDAGNTNEITLEVGPAANADRYYWTLPEGWDFKTGTRETNTGASTIAIPDGIHGGIVQVYAKGKGKCAESNTSTREFRLNPTTPGTITVDYAGAHPTCITKGEPDVVTFSVPEGEDITTYHWSVPSGLGTITSGEGTHSIIVTTVGTGGPYTVQVTAENTCDVSEASVLDQIKVLGAGTVNISIADILVGDAPDQEKVGETLTATQLFPVTYAWTRNGSPVATGRILEVYIPASMSDNEYCVTVTNSTTHCQTVACAASEYNPMRTASSDKVKVSVYPNPAADILNVIVGGSYTNANVSITNILGTEVHKSAITNPKTGIDVSRLTSGTYIVSLKVDNETIVKQVQINR